MNRSHPLWVGLACLAVISSSVRASCAEPSGDDTVQLVIGLLGDKDKDIRALGLEQVRTDTKGRDATVRFAAELSKLFPEAQVGLLSALADRGDDSARPAVVELLASSRDDAVKVAAVEALGLLGQPADAHRLVQILAQSSKAEQSAARLSLVRLRGDAAPTAIVAEMKQAAPSLRAALIGILAERRALSALPEMLAATTDADPKVRGAALAALGRLAGPAEIPGMVQAVLAAKSGAEREAAEKCVALVCLRSEDQQQRAEPLLAVWQGLGEADRRALLSTLGRVGGEKSLTIIEAKIADRDPTQHELGLRALCNWPDSSIAPRLLELAKSDPQPADRTLALAALIRVAPLPDKRPPLEKLELLKSAFSMSTSDSQRRTVLQRARAVRIIQTLRFLVPYLDQPELAQTAAESVVELAHHRDLREPNKAEFDRALDQVIRVSKDPVVVDRANRYKKGETWTRPPAGQ